MVRAPSASRASSASEPVASGRTIGRYVVLSEIGAGGMGRVLAAYDPKLDRRVALKLLHTGAVAGGSKLEEYTVRLDGDGQERNLDRERLLAEARAMARLSHPNLVHVYEVGEVEQQVFLAMEYVSGETLAQHLARAPRSRQDVLRIFVEIGKGLSAIHAAELVHGDIKPSNVLVDTAGRARVVDFGLARLTQPQAAAQPEPVMGTPGYIAPERLERREFDARSDQYSFAVMLRGALSAQSPRAHLPRWLERCLTRAQARDPAARYPSMDSLLAALRRGRFARRRVAVAAGLAAALVTAVLAGRWAGHSGPSCDGGEGRLAGVWDERVATAVHAAMRSTGRPYAEATFTRAAAQLSRYRSDWSALHREVCVATAAGVQSSQLLDRKMLCLGRRLASLRQAAAVLRLPENLTRATEITSSLPALAACNDAEALLAVVPMPEDPARRVAASKLEDRVAAAEIDFRAGHIDVAKHEGEQVLAAARALGYDPLVARAGSLVGRTLDELGRPAEAETSLLEALTAALRGRDDALAATLHVELVGVIGLRQSRVPEALLLSRLAEASFSRAGATAARLERPRLLARLGSIAQVQSELPLAERHITEAVALLRAQLPADDPRLAKAEDLLGSVFLSGGRYQDALRQYQKALSISEQSLGSEHPQVADILNNLAVCYGNLHRPAQTREMYLRALAIVEKLPEHRSTPSILNNLGNIERDAGHFALSIQYHQRALDLRRARLGDKHVAVALSLEGLGSSELEQGEVAKAIKTQRRALEIRKAALDATHPLIGSSLRVLGEALRRAGRAREAAPLLTRAVEIAQTAFGKDHENTRRFRAYAALAQLELGRTAAAVAPLGRALADLPADDPERVQLLFGLARALRGEPDRALALAQEALALAQPLRPAAVPAIERWLAAHPRAAAPVVSRRRR